MLVLRLHNCVLQVVSELFQHREVPEHLIFELFTAQILSNCFLACHATSPKQNEQKCGLKLISDFHLIERYKMDQILRAWSTVYTPITYHILSKNHLCLLTIFSFLLSCSLSLGYFNRVVCCLPFSGLVASEIRLLCDLEQPEPAW